MIVSAVFTAKLTMAHTALRARDATSGSIANALESTRRRRIKMIFTLSALHVVNTKLRRTNGLASSNSGLIAQGRHRPRIRMSKSKMIRWLRSPNHNWSLRSSREPQQNHLSLTVMELMSVPPMILKMASRRRRAEITRQTMRDSKMAAFPRVFCRWIRLSRARHPGRELIHFLQLTHTCRLQPSLRTSPGPIIHYLTKLFPLLISAEIDKLPRASSLP